MRLLCWGMGENKGAAQPHPRNKDHQGYVFPGKARQVPPSRRKE